MARNLKSVIYNYDNNDKNPPIIVAEEEKILKAKFVLNSMLLGPNETD